VKILTKLQQIKKILLNKVGGPTLLLKELIDAIQLIKFKIPDAMHCKKISKLKFVAL